MDQRVKSSLVHHPSFELLLRRLVFESPQVICCYSLLLYLLSADLLIFERASEHTGEEQAKFSNMPIYEKFNKKYTKVCINKRKNKRMDE